MLIIFFLLKYFNAFQNRQKGKKYRTRKLILILVRLLLQTYIENPSVLLKGRHPTRGKASTLKGFYKLNTSIYLIKITIPFHTRLTGQLDYPTGTVKLPGKELL